MQDLKYASDHMYIVSMYDIMMDDKGAKVQRNVFKICKRYLIHIQKSIFEGNLPELNLMKLKAEL
ncbi:CRISPR-associated endonuclease Cas2 [Irregularibacter muris]|uniref:CRISPR-associated endonuclease Cas2 n=1 Tax=Irregularibacter muris TaxID=1796619 RepID=UPI0027D4680F|nr:CRISPR-associated endonuclease Cas2 [Irregularibacter muris]